MRLLRKLPACLIFVCALIALSVAQPVRALTLLRGSGGWQRAQDVLSAAKVARR